MARKTTKTEFADILCTGVDFKNRRIYFGLDAYFEEDAGSDFSWESVEMVVRALHKMASDYKHAPIELHMSSYGGQVDEMLRLYDAIQICPCQIKFFGSGKIMSAATWIMAGCDERYLTPNTQIMVHKWRGEAQYQSEVDHKIDLEHATGWLTNTLNQIYADNSRMPVEFWEEVTKRDLFLTPEEAIKLGLADGIIPYKKRGNLRRKRIAAMNKKVDKSEMRRLVNDINKRIHRGKNLKIELNIPEEKFDDDIYIEERTEVEVNEPLKKEAAQHPQEAHERGKSNEGDSSDPGS